MVGAAIALAVLSSALLVVSISMPVRAQIVSDAFPEYECPVAGTEVFGSDGARIRYGGTAAGVSTMCIVEGVGPRLIGLPPSTGEWAGPSPRNLENLLRTGVPYFLVGDRPPGHQCRQRPLSGQWPSPDLIQHIGRLQHLSRVVILRYEAFKRTCGFVTEFENTEIWIDTATRVPIRISIHRSLGPPVLPAVAPREERIEWHAVAIERIP